MPPTRKKRGLIAPAPQPAKGGGRSRSVTSKTKRDRGKAEPAKRKKKPAKKKPIAKQKAKVSKVSRQGTWLAKRFSRANAIYMAERVERKRAKHSRKISKREQAANRKADFLAWEDAGQPGDFDRYASRREGWRTRRLDSKWHALDARRREIFGYVDAKGKEVIPRYLEAHGSNRNERVLLQTMMRDGDPRFLEYLDAAEDLGVDYDEALDGWFSPEV